MAGTTKILDKHLYPEILKIECKHCGFIFASEIGKKRYVFCSKKCQDNNRISKQKIKDNTPTGIEKLCKTCNILKDEMFYTKDGERRRPSCKECIKKTKKKYNIQVVEKKNLLSPIEKWCKRAIINRGGRRSRENLTLEIVIPLAEEALKKFPYIDYEAIRELGDRASIDRIDNNKGYEKDNVRIVPLWLNYAKSTFSKEDFEKRIEHYNDLCKSKNYKILTVSNGTFRATLHPGHIDFLKKCKVYNNSDDVCIFLDSQKRVQEIKPGKFCFSDEQRKHQLLSQKFISDVEIFSTEEELKQKIEQKWKEFKEKYSLYNQHILIYSKGGDYKLEDLKIKDFIESIGGVVNIIPYKEGYSTTNILKTLSEEYKKGVLEKELIDFYQFDKQEVL